MTTSPASPIAAQLARIADSLDSVGFALSGLADALRGDGEHTPGPWRLIDTLSSTVVYAMERNEIGDFDPETGEHAKLPMFDREIVRYGSAWTSATRIEHANARLIAASPRMADAIRAAAASTSVIQLGEHVGMVMMPRALFDEMENALDAATGEFTASEERNRAAIAKAGA